MKSTREEKVVNSGKARERERGIHVIRGNSSEKVSALFSSYFLFFPSFLWLDV